MKRKLIQLARKTLVVSLPISWIEKNMLKKGHEVEVVERGTHLLVTGKKTIPSRITFTAPETRLIKRDLADVYIKGYDEVCIRFSSPKTFQYIQEEDLLGFEVMEQTTQHCVLKNVTQPEEEAFDIMLRRTFLLLKEMGKEAELLEKKKTTPEQLLLMEKTTNKFTNFCKRFLQTHGHEKNEFILYLIVAKLEEIGDYYKYYAEQPKRKVKEVNAFFEQAYHLFYTPKDIERNTLYTQYETLMKQPLPPELKFIVEATYHLLGPITTLHAEELFST